MFFKRNNSSSQDAVVILAAGKGKRMKNPSASKVMHLLNGKPLIEYVLKQALSISPQKIIVIVGHCKDSVIDFVSSRYDKVEFAEQIEQLGTGHAVAQANNNLASFEGNILILSGDVPLLKSFTISEFVASHKNGNYDLSVLSVETDESFGYGRIVRDTSGRFQKIVEEKDASEEEKLINEINSGIYYIKAQFLFDALNSISNQNSQGEYYLTDIVEILNSQGYTINCYNGATANEIQGINSPEDLTKAELIIRNEKL